MLMPFSGQDIAPDEFDRSALLHCGRHVIIGRFVRIRHPERVSLGDYTIIDDFTYISSGLTTGRFVHIASNSVILGGPGECVYEDFSGNSPGCRIITCSDDYLGGIACPQIPRRFKGDVVIGKVVLKRHALLGTGCVVLPNVTLNEGAATGALSVVNRDLGEWSLNVGVPAKPVKMRNRDRILELEKAFLDEYVANGNVIAP